MFFRTLFLFIRLLWLLNAGLATTYLSRILERPPQQTWFRPPCNQTHTCCDSDPLSGFWIEVLYVENTNVLVTDNMEFHFSCSRCGESNIQREGGGGRQWKAIQSMKGNTKQQDSSFTFRSFNKDYKQLKGRCNDFKNYINTHQHWRLFIYYISLQI